MRAALALAGTLALALAAGGCIYSPAGHCGTTTDCAAGERCDSGVCVASGIQGGGGGGVDPTSFTTVLWSTLDPDAAGTAFDVDSVGADLAGNVVIAGAVDASFDFGPTAVGTGAFVLARAAADGAVLWATSFPTFAHGRFGATVLPGGDVLFAGTAFDATSIGTALSYTPPLAGALFFGRLDGATGTPVWAQAVNDTSTTSPLAPVAVAASGAGDLLVAGVGSGVFVGCADTAGATFAAALSGTDGSCRWSRGFGTRTISGIEPTYDGSVAVAGVCTPTGASFDPGLGTTCAKGLYLVTVDGTSGSPVRARFTFGAGTISAVRSLAAAPDGRASVVGDASGTVDFGRGPVDFGSAAASFAATWDASGAATALVRPVEAPYAASPDAAAFSRCAYDRSGRLWIAGTYVGQPTLGGVRFTACRAPGCRAAAFLARLEAGGDVSSFLPIDAVPWPNADGGAFVDDLALFATTGTVAAALRFTGDGAVGGTAWTSAGGGLGVVRAAP